MSGRDKSKNSGNNHNHSKEMHGLNHQGAMSLMGRGDSKRKVKDDDSSERLEDEKNVHNHSVPNTNNSVIGTADDDVLEGTSNDDLIKGLAGNDVLNGKTGDDVLIGGKGDDDLFGGEDPEFTIETVGYDFTSIQLSPDQLDPNSPSDLTIIPFKKDGSTDPSFLTTSNNGLGVAGATGGPNAQLGYDERTDQAEKIEFQFGDDVEKATISLSRFFAEEGNGDDSEAAQWMVFNDGILVGSGQVISDSGTTNTFTIEGLGPFDTLEISALPYNASTPNNPNNTGDSSDFFISGLEVDYIRPLEDSDNDTAVFHGNLDEYIITRETDENNVDYIQVSDTVPDRDGTDRLYDIETLKFCDETIHVNDIPEENAPPTLILTPVLVDISEDADTSDRIKVADIEIQDDILGQNDLSLSDDSLFEIDGLELYLKAGVNLDHETMSTLSVDIMVDDATVGNTPDDMASFSLSVLDVNEAPMLNVIPVLNDIAEDADTGDRIKVADIEIIDDGLGVNDLSLSDDSLFEIDGLELYLKAGVSLDHETMSTLSVEIMVDDATVGNTPDDMASFSLAVLDVNEAPMLNVIPVLNDIAEDADTGDRIKVADIEIIDDGLGVNDLSLSDDSLFEIDGLELYLKAGVSLDHETMSTLSVEIMVDDATVGNTPDDMASFSLAVLDVNEAPMLNVIPVLNDIAEDADTGDRIKVADIEIIDDVLGVNDLSLSDDSLFEIDGLELYLKAGVNLDHETMSTLSVDIMVDDDIVGSTPDDMASFSLAVLDVNEPPVTDDDFELELEDGEDDLDGGPGNDEAIYIDDTTPKDIRISREGDDGFRITEVESGEQDVLKNIEELTVGKTYNFDADNPDTPTEMNDLLLGTDQADTIDGKAGDDLIYGGDGDDIIQGDNGTSQPLPDKVLNAPEGETLSDQEQADAQAIDLSNIEFGKDTQVNIQFDSEGAGYKNVLGYYLYDDSGNILQIEILGNENKDSYNISAQGSGGQYQSGDIIDTIDIPQGSKLGLFLLPDAVNLNSEADFTTKSVGLYRVDDNNNPIPDGNGGFVMATINATDDQGNDLNGDNAPRLFFETKNGNGEVISLDIVDTRSSDALYHTTATGSGYSLNADGILHAVNGLAQDEKSISIGFEDLFNGGDKDFDDVIVTISPVLSHDDIIFGEGGNDTIYGNEGDDCLDGGEGNDILMGGLGNDELVGGTGDDILEGGEGDDVAFGGDGEDNLKGNDGNDQLFGEKGDDILEGGKGDDHIDGGEDTITEIETINYDFTSGNQDFLQDSDLTIIPYKQDGTTDPSFLTVTGNGLGVAGATGGPNAQLGYDERTDRSERIEFQFGDDVNRAEVDLTRLFNDEHSGGDEAAKWQIFNDGELVGEGQGVAPSGNTLTFVIEGYGEFDTLVLSALPYNETGPNDPNFINDSSDYFISGLEVDYVRSIDDDEDIAVFTGSCHEYIITMEVDENGREFVKVVDTIPDRDGTDHVYDVEKYKFGDAEPRSFEDLCNKGDVNLPPTLTLTPVLVAIPEDADTSARIKVADIVINDDGIGTNDLSLSDDSLFEIDGLELYLKAGVVLDHETLNTLSVDVSVDDVEVGMTPDDTETFVLSVTDVNDVPPQIELIPILLTVPEETDTNTEIATINIIDPDGGDNQLTLIGDDADKFIIVGDKLVLKGDADLDATNMPELDVGVAVDDPLIGTSPDDQDFLTVNVTEGNEPPTPNDDDIKFEVDEDNEIRIDAEDLKALFTDAENDPLTIESVIIDGTPVMLDVADNTYPYTPPLNFNSLVGGELDIQVVVSDGVNDPVSGSTTLYVNPVNDAPEPIPNPSPFAVEEDSFIDFSVSELKDLFTDIDTAKSALTIVSVTAKYPNETSTETVPIVDGDYRFTPRPDYNGDVEITVVISDGEFEATNVIDIIVRPGDDLPDVSGPLDVDAVYEDGVPPAQNADPNIKSGPAVFTLAALFATIDDPDVLGDLDPDNVFIEGESITDIFDAGSLAVDNGVITISGDPRTEDPTNIDITFTPDADYFTRRDDASPPLDDPLEIGFSYMDDQGDTVSDVIKITVVEVNDAPVADDNNADGNNLPKETAVIIDEGDSLNLDIASVFSDVDQDTLTYSLSATDMNGAPIAVPAWIMLTPGGSLMGVPGESDDGDFILLVTANDGRGGTDTYTIDFLVNEVNNNPEPEDDSGTGILGDNLTVLEDNVLLIDPAVLLANDSDPENDTLTIIGVQAGQNGTVRLIPPVDPETNQPNENAGMIEFIPDQDFPGLASSGEATFTYTVTDGENQSMATVTVKVIEDNDAPVFTMVSDRLTRLPEDAQNPVDPEDLQTVPDNNEDSDNSTVFEVSGGTDAIFKLFMAQDTNSNENTDIIFKDVDDTFHIFYQQGFDQVVDGETVAGFEGRAYVNPTTGEVKLSSTEAAPGADVFNDDSALTPLEAGTYELTLGVSDFQDTDTIKIKIVIDDAFNGNSEPETLELMTLLDDSDQLDMPESENEDTSESGMNTSSSSGNNENGFYEGGGEEGIGTGSMPYDPDSHYDPTNPDPTGMS